MRWGTDYQLGSDPQVAPGGNYYGAGYNIAWAPDQDVGTVVECNKVQQPLIVLHYLCSFS